MTEAAAAIDPEEPVVKRRLVVRIARAVGIAVLYFVLFLLMAWSVLAVCYTDLNEASPRTIRAIVLALIAVTAVIVVRPHKLGYGVCLVLFGIVLAWFFSRQPSNQRDWRTDVAEVPRVQINGDAVTIHNMRNFDYRSETDFTPHWETRAYRLSELRAVDMMLCYWGSKDIAHGMVSFDFGNDQIVCASIEVRKQQSEDYSNIQGFFRQYELIYIFADERDLVRLRTNFRKEDVYLYHTNITPEQGKALFLSYAKKANDLAEHPQFYNALTSNCVTNVVYHARAFNPSAYVGWDILLSGRAARQAYRNGWLDSRIPYDELEAKSHINPAAVAASLPDYSRAIRVGLPIPPPHQVPGPTH